MKSATKTLLVSLLALCIVLLGMQIAVAEVEKDFSTPEKVEETYQAIFNETPAARVTTLENGVKIQRTPTTPDSGIALSSYIGYNIRYLNADNRGCGACHTDLAETLANMDYPHVSLKNNMGFQLTVNQCIYCHDNSGLAETTAVGSMMHAIHSGSSNPTFSAMGGDCMSCHYSSEDGKGMQLWDNVKHSVLRGITDIDAENVDATATWGQDKVMSADNVFAVNWSFEPVSTERYLYDIANVKPDPEHDGVYDQYTISVGGDVTTPTTHTINEWIEIIGVETATMKFHCGLNSIGSPWVGNYEITGISIAKMLEYCGASADTKLVECGSSRGDGFNMSTPAEWVFNNGAYLVLTVGGEPIPYEDGYPTASWCAGGVAWNATKACDTINALVDDSNAWIMSSGYHDQNGVSYFKPNVGMFDLTEGQIFEAGKPVHLEGYADAWETPITAVEYSFDQGKTWATIDTTGANTINWVNFSIDWNAPSEGAYVFSVRAVDELGEVTVAPLEYLINVQ